MTVARGLVMAKIRLDLENCYGIRKLDAELDFGDKNATAIYAPNGMMKSSLANTFDDLSKGIDSRDRIYPERKPKRNILDEAGTQLRAEQVFVVRPFERNYGDHGRTSILLVNSELRDKYRKLLAGVEKAKTELLAALKKQAQSRTRDFETEISQIIANEPNAFKKALFRIQAEVLELHESALESLAYDKVFDPKALEIIAKNKDLQGAVGDYVTQYNKLLDTSIFFKRGRFDLYNAAHVAKTLTSHGFFAASHTVTLTDPNGPPRIVKSQHDLESVISEEKERIMKDAQLIKKFDQVSAVLQVNDTGRSYADYLMDHQFILPELSNVDKFKEKVLLAYLRANLAMYQTLLNEYTNAEKELEKIYEQARQEQTRWESVIAQFNARFTVPFELVAENKLDVMMGTAKTTQLGYLYKDGNNRKPVGESVLQTLSTGEEKAFYVLNLLFEVATRRLLKTETLMVVDDIADSFDYQNKYAIIQYLKEISEDDDGLFKLLILSHNFDFFRTLASRDVTGYGNCYMALKRNDAIELLPAWDIIKNVFGNWKAHFFDEPRKRIAAIPFLRNLIEYMRGKTDQIYLDLTSLLHWKDDSPTITEGRLDEIYNEMFNGTQTSADQAKPVVESIFEQADACLGVGDGTHFETKIVMSLAIRLKAERYMTQEINNSAAVTAITSNQTPKLLKLFKAVPGVNGDAVAAIERVILMTPENIHLNSFMYEPIIDMSDEHLKTLYRDVSALDRP